MIVGVKKRVRRTKVQAFLSPESVRALDLYWAGLKQDPKRDFGNSTRSDAAGFLIDVGLRAVGRAAEDVLPPPKASATVRYKRYHFPLRPDLIISLDLPRILTKADVKRLSAYLESLALD